jgi:hypothetical protein
MDKMKKYHFGYILSLIVISMITLPMGKVFAHCDTMDGPVVKAAQKALETGNVNLVLIWVQPKNEGIIKEAFDKTLKVRKLSPESKELADMYFFETLVRIHRAGEGEPYTGIKPASTEVEPGIEMADNAVEKSSENELLEHLSKAIREKVIGRFNEVKETKKYNKDDVNGGRKFVKAYVEFIHYIEGIHKSITGSTEGHAHE